MRSVHLLPEPPVPDDREARESQFHNEAFSNDDSRRQESKFYGHELISQPDPGRAYGRRAPAAAERNQCYRGLLRRIETCLFPLLVLDDGPVPKAAGLQAPVGLLRRIRPGDVRGDPAHAPARLDGDAGIKRAQREDGHRVA